MRANKRGALELSVTGVVVLIIAIVVLGSVIYFVRSFFGETQGIIGKQLQSVKDTLRETMKNSGESIVMDFGTELKLKTGQPTTAYIGLTNDYSNNGKGVCYFVQIVCMRSFSQGGCGVNAVPIENMLKNQRCNQEARGEVLVGGYPVINNPVSKISPPIRDQSGQVPTEKVCSSWTPKMLAAWNIPDRNTDSTPITFQVSGPNADTYQMEARVFVMSRGGQYLSCDEAIADLTGDSTGTPSGDTNTESDTGATAEDASASSDGESSGAIFQYWNRKRFTMELS